MKWRRGTSRPKPVEPELTEGKAALKRAEKLLARIEAQQPEVDQLQREAQDHRRSNHFTEKIEALFGIGGAR